MSEDPLAAIQPPVDDGGGATPPEPPTPPEPAAPVVPEPPVDGTGKDGELTEAEKAEADEWDAAADELFPGLKKTEDDKKPEEGKKDDEPAKPKEDAKTPEADKKPAIDPNETPEQKTAREAKEAADAAAAKGDEEDVSTEPTDANARLTAREQQAQVEAVKSDVREKMFPNIVTELRDADGDPIRSVDDLMKLNNPRTGQPFTEEEAGMFLLQATQQLKDNIANVEHQIDLITETNLDLKDQADVINYGYGELLRAMPELRASLWAQYEKTLTKDNKSGIITKAPVSLQSFYEAALEPYAELGRKLEAEETAKGADAAKAEADAKAAADAKKTQTRQDRSDIYGSGKVDTQTDEDKEWSAAAEAVFGPLNK